MYSYEKYRHKNDTLHFIKQAENIEEFLKNNKDENKEKDNEDSNVSVVFYKKAEELKCMRYEKEEEEPENASSSSSVTPNSSKVVFEETPRENKCQDDCADRDKCKENR